MAIASFIVMPLITPVGWMVLTLMLCGARSSANTCMSPTMPRLAAV